MKAISRLLLACAAVTIAASQADAGEFVVTGAGGYRYRNAPPPAYAHGPWRYRRDWAPRYYAPRSTTTISGPRLRARWPVPRCS